MTGSSKEYASALFSLARESGTERELLDGLSYMQEIFSDAPEYMDFLASPGIPKSERLATLDTLSGEIPEYASSFISLLCEHGAIRSFSECAKEYELLYTESIRLSRATVTSAVPLSEDEKEKLRKKLAAISGHSVELDCATDESLLGGAIVEMDGARYDGSLRHQLQNMKEVMEK